MTSQANRGADRAAAQPGLFDHIPQPASTPSPDKVRARLMEWLETARHADRMPWDAYHERKYAIMFHQMADWLPPEERERLRSEFSYHLERLRAAA